MNQPNLLPRHSTFCALLLGLLLQNCFTKLDYLSIPAAEYASKNQALKLSIAQLHSKKDCIFTLYEINGQYQAVINEGWGNLHRTYIGVTSAFEI
ncbi:MAG: hypothetical protein ACYC2U_01565 [Candidatus Amoebophilus sp.]